MKTLMLRALLAICAVAALNTTTPANSSNRDDSRIVTVMTRNMYLGAEFDGVLGATSFPEFANEVAELYIHVEQSRIQERAAAVAREIDSARPQLIGLQEVGVWRTGPFGGPATTVTFDSLQSLLDALSARGLHYTPIAILTEFEAEAPSALGINIGFTDRDVILARTDLNTSELILSNIQAQHFTTNLMFMTPVLGPLTIPRGWLSVEGKIRGKRFRFVTSHLESFHPGIQALQASELIQAATNTTLPVIIAGDLNTESPSGNPMDNAGYQILRSSAFSDIWTLLHEGEAGNTWALHVGDSLTATAPSQRLDIVFFRGAIDAEEVELAGNQPTGGVWPSDHAGVVASFDLKQE